VEDVDMDVVSEDEAEAEVPEQKVPLEVVVTGGKEVSFIFGGVVVTVVISIRDGSRKRYSLHYHKCTPTMSSLTPQRLLTLAKWLDEMTLQDFWLPDSLCLIDTRPLSYFLEGLVAQLDELFQRAVALWKAGVWENDGIKKVQYVKNVLCQFLARLRSFRIAYVNDRKLQPDKRKWSAQELLHWNPAMDIGPVSKKQEYHALAIRLAKRTGIIQIGMRLYAYEPPSRNVHFVTHLTEQTLGKHIVDNINQGDQEWYGPISSYVVDAFMTMVKKGNGLPHVEASALNLRMMFLDDAVFDTDNCRLYHGDAKNPQNCVEGGPWYTPIRHTEVTLLDMERTPMPTFKNLPPSAEAYFSANCPNAYKFFKLHLNKMRDFSAGGAMRSNGHWFQDAMIYLALIGRACLLDQEKHGISRTGFCLSGPTETGKSLFIDCIASWFGEDFVGDLASLSDKYGMESVIGSVNNHYPVTVSTENFVYAEDTITKIKKLLSHETVIIRNMYASGIRTKYFGGMVLAWNQGSSLVRKTSEPPSDILSRFVAMPCPQRIPETKAYIALNRKVYREKEMIPLMMYSSFLAKNMTAYMTTNSYPLDQVIPYRIIQNSVYELVKSSPCYVKLAAFQEEDSFAITKNNYNPGADTDFVSLQYIVKTLFPQMTYIRKGANDFVIRKPTDDEYLQSLIV